MEVIHSRVAGIDVHKKIVWVAVRLPGQRPGERTVTAKRFKTFWRSLRKMAAWLPELGVTDTAMESTGVYWRPVYHALAGAGIEICVCNAAHMRNVPGRKRDVMDCQQLPGLHEHGLLRTGFIPVGAVAELRSRTPVPQGADRAAHQRGPAAGQGAGGRRHQDRPRWPPGCRVSRTGR
jgi:transposase